jgi:hypothetical protein
VDGFLKTASGAALVAAAGGILYGLFFVVLNNQGVASALLMLGGLLSSLVLVALAASLSELNPPLVRWASIVGVVGSLLSLVHGGFDLANVINPPDATLGGLPNPADPRGLATFGLTGLAYFLLSRVMARSGGYSRGLASLGQALGVLMIVIYLGRLIILDPTNLVVRVALVLGVAANTAFFVGLGLRWRRGTF